MKRFPKPPDFGLTRRIFNMSGPALSWCNTIAIDNYIRNNTKKSCFFEFHSPFFLERFPNLINRSILHVHGSEIRKVLSDGSMVEDTSDFLKFALQHVPLILYSTPDLETFLLKYNSKIAWAPHLTENAVFDRKVANVKKKTFDAVFPSTFTLAKGASRILKLISEALTKRPTLRILGIRYGEHSTIAEELGVILIPQMPRKQFLKCLQTCDVAIGQGSGGLGAADIEAIQLGMRFFPVTPSIHTQNAYELSTDTFPDADNLVETFLHFFDVRSFQYREFQDAVIHKHSAEYIWQKLLKSYRNHLT